jgi:peptidyl-dipeptidase Dcp
VTTTTEDTHTSSNPLLVRSTLPFDAPPFDAIADSDFGPALEEAMRRHRDEIETIAHTPTAPTFENTIEALERSGQALLRVTSVFNVLASANTNDTLQQLQEAIAPRLAAHNDAIWLNAKLFARVEAVHAERRTLALDAESQRLLDVLHERFVLAGARLSDTDKAALTILNEEEASLSAGFLTKLLAASKDSALVLRDRSELDGLSGADVADAAATARSRGLEGQWVLTLSNTTQQPLLRHLRHRPTRERLFRASVTRTTQGDANDTSVTISRLAAVRASRARLLGQPSHAAWRLQNQMAKSPDRVEQFLAQLVPAATVKAQAEETEIRALVEAHNDDARLEPWDWPFYAEQVRQATYDLSEADITPYFELDRVLRDGAFYAAEQLYGLTANQRDDLPVYHSDVRVFEILDAHGSHIGLFYADFFRRDNKNGGAWMDNLVPQSTLLGTQPIICIVFNFAKPAPGQPALLGLEDVLTIFHEFGHALHGLLANQRYPGLSGTAVARDFVELPALFNEHWALDSKVFARYARHYLTGAPMPTELAAKIAQAATVNQGYALTELLAAAKLDIGWHSLSEPPSTLDVDHFEQVALKEARLDIPVVPPRYHSRFFLHIWANGYDASYYAYLWAEMLAHDAFAWFKERGGLTRENGQRFSGLVLSRGNTQDYDDMFRAFRGRGPVIGPMLEFRGLTPF